MSQRLVGSAATLVQSSYGMSPTMARYMRAQAVAFGEKDTTMTGSQQVRLRSSTSTYNAVLTLKRVRRMKGRPRDCYYTQAATYKVLEFCITGPQFT